MKRSLLILFALTALLRFVSAEAQFDFLTALPKGWTATVAPNGYEERGAQFIANSELSLPGVSNVTEVTIVCSTNIEGEVNSIEVKIGDTSLGARKLPKANNQTLTFKHDTALDGELRIIITRTKKSVWIRSVTIDGTYDSSIEDEDLTEGLDAAYSYAEPTKVLSTDSLGSKLPYTFTCNNVKVIASMGTKTASYFGANANSTLTLVTTRKMKALVVDGFLRKGFTASASAGTIAYKTSDGVDIEEAEVLAVMDIDTNIVTLACDKQLRCHEVRIYFEANPEVDIQGGSEPYSYYYEPEQVRAFDLQFDSLQYVDMTANLGYACTSLLFTSGEAELTLAVFAPTDDDTILPVGTYPINDSYAANTVQASPGGDEYMDYPSYLATDFELGENSNWLYNPYYIVSGTLEVLAMEGGVAFILNATSYNGSTIKAAYMNGKGEPYVEEAVNPAYVIPHATKMLRDGQLFIRQGNKCFGINGEEK